MRSSDPVVFATQTIQGARVSKMDAPCFSPLSLARETIIEAMEKLKGKTGQQKVTVEHVHVYQGGQAIVGAVSPNRGRGASE
jgi:hypothetical protein